MYRPWWELSPAEAGSTANQVVLSYGMWKGRFASAPEIVGQTLEIDQAAYEVVGVMPETFEFPDKDVEVWLPITCGARGPSALADGGIALSPLLN